jgi:hypothetical protein
MLKRRLKGQLNYVHRLHGVTGHEWWNIAVATDDTRTLTANCEMRDDSVQRDVVYSVDAMFRPMDAFVRLAVGGEFQGSSWFHFSDSGVEAEGYTKSEGRFHQRYETLERAKIFAPHPVQSDAWQTANFRHSHATKRQRIESCFNPSPLPNGASGPMLSKTSKHISFVGEEEVRVPAGLFKCLHYRIHPKDYKTPINIWTFGQDRVLALCTWETLDSRYELVEFEEKCFDAPD